MLPDFKPTTPKSQGDITLAPEELEVNACYINIPCVDIPDGLTLHPGDIFFPTLIGQTPIYSEDNLPIGHVDSYYYPNWENSNWSWNWDASGVISDWRGQGAAVAAGFVDLGLASAGITVTVGSITIPVAATVVGMVLVVDLSNQSVTIESGYIVHTNVIPLYNGPSPQQLIEDTFNPFPLP